MDFCSTLCNGRDGGFWVLEEDVYEESSNPDSSSSYRDCSDVRRHWRKCDLVREIRKGWRACVGWLFILMLEVVSSEEDGRLEIALDEIDADLKVPDYHYECCQGRQGWKKSGWFLEGCGSRITTSVGQYTSYRVQTRSLNGEIYIMSMLLNPALLRLPDVALRVGLGERVSDNGFIVELEDRYLPSSRIRSLSMKKIHRARAPQSSSVEDVALRIRLFVLISSFCSLPPPLTSPC
ncbi:hypothetical protein L218DRAFT_992346, partial [Marasmius fiardii PR-910]